MRWMIVVLALATGVGAMVVRVPESAGTPISRVPRSTRVEMELSLARTEAGADGARSLGATVEAPTPIPVESGPIVEPEPVDDAVDGVDEGFRAQVLSIMRIELRLNPEQAQGIARILKERDAEMETTHARIRASKVLIVWQYESQARGVLLASQNRIRAVLDPRQSERYMELLESGKLAEGVGFQVTPEITVVR